MSLALLSPSHSSTHRHIHILIHKHKHKHRHWYTHTQIHVDTQTQSRKHKYTDTHTHSHTHSSTITISLFIILFLSFGYEDTLAYSFILTLLSPCNAFFISFRRKAMTKKRSRGLYLHREALLETSIKCHMAYKNELFDQVLSWGSL